MTHSRLAAGCHISPLPMLIGSLAAAPVAGCSQHAERASDAAPAVSVSAAAQAVSASPPLSPEGGVEEAGGVPELPGRTDGCEPGMVRVEGQYCPVVLHKCAEYHPEYVRNKQDKNVSDRCLRYKEPARCFVPERKNLSFCMDRFEYPNRIGELPRVLTSWLQARALCSKEGKRLCTEDEFNFACEGPDILPYAYGYVRDEAKCNIDRHYERPDLSRRMKTYDECPLDPWCKEELARLDQRHRIGTRLTCLSWAGIVDINGNANEWVELPGKEPPHRSGLKGGWWGPVRSRCRPTVTFHKEFDYGYEAGFRCCKDAT